MAPRLSVLAVGVAATAWIAIAADAVSEPTGPAHTDAAGRVGDPVRGEVVFQRCYACHSVEPDETGLPGPNLHGVIGRAAATRPDFEYSPAMREAARLRPWTWTDETLDAFIADPDRWLPGTTMGYTGLDSGERADVIAYLRASADAKSPED